MSTRTIALHFDNSPSISCTPGTTLSQLLQEHPDLSRSGFPALGAVVNNELVSLEYRVEVDSRVRLLTYRDSNGQRIYRHTAAFLLAKLAHELFPQADFSVEHALSRGLYCSFSLPGQEGITPEQLAQLEAELRALINANTPIERVKISFEEAVQYFEQEGQADKLNLLRFQNPSKVSVYQCGRFLDLAHAPLAMSAGALHAFKLTRHAAGFVIQGPDRNDPAQFAPFDPAPYLFDIFQAHKQWGRQVQVRTVGDLNNCIARHDIDNFIDLNEAYQERRIVLLACDIARHRDRLKWILIAGPSSSGKTTFSKRLALQLRVGGLHTHAISLDHYFVERGRTPLDDRGEPDYEHVEALDLLVLNEHLAALDRGEEVQLPYFNFETGQREFRGHKLRLKENDVVILEGIHGLNPRLTEHIPPERKFRIYISALTQLNLDNNNRISTTDNRLIRRIVRDNNFRGHSALTTLEWWPKVRRGEKTWIFPYQKEADVAFNSALDYELAVLKPFAEPLLSEVKPFHPQYAEARRLQQFLENFLTVPPDRVPPTSVIREFIGRSNFEY